MGSILGLCPSSATYQLECFAETEWGRPLTFHLNFPLYKMVITELTKGGCSGLNGKKVFAHRSHATAFLEPTIALFYCVTGICQANRVLQDPWVWLDALF